MPNFLTHEVVSGIAHAGIDGPVVFGVLGACSAFATDAHEAVLTEAAAFVPILVEAAGGSNEGRAALGGTAVDLIVGASSASAVDQVEAEGAHAGLLGVRVDLIGTAGNNDACVVDAGVAGTAAACIVLGIVGLVVRATLTDVLDYLQAGLALANAIDEYLVGSAGVDAVAPLCNWIISVPIGANAASSIDAIVVSDAVAVECDGIEFLIFAALVAVQVRTGGDLWSGLAAIAILGVDCG